MFEGLFQVNLQRGKQLAEIMWQHLPIFSAFIQKFAYFCMKFCLVFLKLVTAFTQVVSPSGIYIHITQWHKVSIFCSSVQDTYFLHWNKWILKMIKEFIQGACDCFMHQSNSWEGQLFLICACESLHGKYTLLTIVDSKKNIGVPTNNFFFFFLIRKQTILSFI